MGNAHEEVNKVRHCGISFSPQKAGNADTCYLRDHEPVTEERTQGLKKSGCQQQEAEHHREHQVPLTKYRVPVLQDENISVAGSWQWEHSSVNVVSAEKIQMINCM